MKPMMTPTAAGRISRCVPWGPRVVVLTAAHHGSHLGCSRHAMSVQCLAIGWEELIVPLSKLEGAPWPPYVEGGGGMVGYVLLLLKEALRVLKKSLGVGVSQTSLGVGVTKCVSLPAPHEQQQISHSDPGMSHFARGCIASPATSPYGCLLRVLADVASVIVLVVVMNFFLFLFFLFFFFSSSSLHPNLKTCCFLEWHLPIGTSACL